MLSLIGPAPFLTKDDRTARKTANDNGQPTSGGIAATYASLDEDEIVSFISTKDHTNGQRQTSAPASKDASVRTEQLDIEVIEMVSGQR